MNHENLSRFEIAVPPGVSVGQPAPLPVPGALRPRKAGKPPVDMLLARRTLAPEERAVEELRALARNMSSAMRHIKSAQASQSAILDFPNEVLQQALKTKANMKLFKSVCAERNKLGKPLNKLAAALDQLVQSLQPSDDSECPPAP
jgi:hypothetical protein